MGNDNWHVLPDLPSQRGARPGDVVTSMAFPGKLMILQPDGTLKPVEPFKPGDRMQIPMGEWFVLQTDGKTWSRE